MIRDVTLEPDVDDLTEFVKEIYDKMETTAVEVIFSGVEAIPNKEKWNEFFWELKEKYKQAHVEYWVTLLRLTYLMQNNIKYWSELFNETKQRAEKEFGPEKMKDMMYGMLGDKKII